MSGFVTVTMSGDNLWSNASREDLCASIVVLSAQVRTLQDLLNKAAAHKCAPSSGGPS